MKSWGSSEGEDDVDLEGPVEQVRGFEPAQALHHHRRDGWGQVTCSVTVML